MYNPTQNLLQGVKSAFEKQMMPWDEYFMRMAETDYLNGRASVRAVKSYFIREAPFGGSYALLGGVAEMLNTVSCLRFDTTDFRKYLEDMDYNPRFVDFMTKTLKFLRLEIYSGREGGPFFPNEPIISACGDLISTRLFEGINTEANNFATLSLTKWNRLVRTVRPGQVMEFSRRRAQNMRKSTLYGMLAGCSSTSNSEMRRHFDFYLGATFGHEFVQSYGNVRDAFDAWLTVQPRRPIGLVDTVNTMKVDFPAWLDAVFQFRESIKNAGPAIWGWRNDSGDLARLVIDQYLGFFRHPLAQDSWFCERMRIVLTNDLDEYSAQSIIQQIRAQAGAAGFNAEDILRRIIWAAGTKPGTCQDQSSLGGVAKLFQVEDLECMKLAFDSKGNAGLKTSIPGFNLSAIVHSEELDEPFVLIYPDSKYRISPEGQFLAKSSGVEKSLISGVLLGGNEHIAVTKYHAMPQQFLVWNSHLGYGVGPGWDDPTIETVQKRVMQSVDALPWTMSRLDSPQVMKVCLTPELHKLRERMIAQGVLRADMLNPNM